MRKLLFAILFLVSASAFSQTIPSKVYIRADSLQVYRQDGFAELILMNRTKDSTGGVITNIGGGRTAFKKSKVLNDSTFTVGGDTLTLRGATGSSTIIGDSLTWIKRTGFDTLFYLKTPTLGAIKGLSVTSADASILTVTKPTGTNTDSTLHYLLTVNYDAEFYNALKLRGRNVSNAVPSNLQYLGWNSTTNLWEPKTIPPGGVPGGSGGDIQLNDGFGGFGPSPLNSNGALIKLSLASYYNADYSASMTTDRFIPDIGKVNSLISGKANLASPAFTGVPTGPTASVGTNTTQLATTAFVLANAGSGGTTETANEGNTKSGLNIILGNKDNSTTGALTSDSYVPIRDYSLWLRGNDAFPATKSLLVFSHKSTAGAGNGARPMFEFEAPYDYNVNGVKDTRFGMWQYSAPNDDGSNDAVVKWGFNIDQAEEPNQHGLWWAMEPHWRTGGAKYREVILQYAHPTTHEQVRLLMSTFVERDSLGNSSNTWDFRGTEHHFKNLLNIDQFAITDNQASLFGNDPIFTIQDTSNANYKSQIQQVDLDFVVGTYRNTTFSAPTNGSTGSFTLSKHQLIIANGAMQISNAISYGGQALVDVETTTSSHLINLKVSGSSKLWMGNNGRLALGNTGPNVSLEVTATDAILLPKGTTSEQPTGVAGYFRFNTDSSKFEGYDGSGWVTFGAGGVSGGVSGITQLTGDVTAGPGSGSQATTITDNAVTLPKIQTISEAVVLGKGSGGGGNVRELTFANDFVFDVDTIKLLRDAENGITYDGSPGIYKYVLGGTLNKHVTFNGIDNHGFSFNQLDSFNVDAASPIRFNTPALTVRNGSSDVAFNLDVAGTTRWGVAVNSGTGEVGIEAGAGGYYHSFKVNTSEKLRITGSVNTTYQLLKYDADYSGSYDNRTLVDKEYVDDAIAGVGGGLTTVAFGSTPNSNGGGISGATLTLQPADGSNPGGLSTTTQSVAGLKTWLAGLKTGTPTGGTAGTWKLGIAQTTSGLVLSSTQYIEVDIGGTLYHLAIVELPSPKPLPQN